MAQERLIRPREVANRLAVSRSTVYRWFWEGNILLPLGLRHKAKRV